MRAYYPQTERQNPRSDRLRASPSRQGHTRQSLRLKARGELFVLDFVALSLVLSLSILNLSPYTFTTDLGAIALISLILPFYFVGAFNSGAYSDAALLTPTSAVFCSVKALGYSVLMLLLVAFALHETHLIPRLAFSAGIVFSGIVLAGIRAAYTVRIQRLSGGLLTNELLILDGQDVPVHDAEFVYDARQNNLVPDVRDPLMLHDFGTLTKPFDRVVIACSEERRAQWTLLLKGVEVTGEILAPNFNELGAIGVNNFLGFDTLQVSRKTLNLRGRAQKRFFDLSLAIPALILLMPLLVLVAIAIKLESPGPIFFRQERVGHGNRFFYVFKFRSMYTHACDISGNVSTRRGGDPRVTRVGRIIRSTSIDELPQLINVLLGEMSIVGPRPHALGSLAGDRLFWEVDSRYWHRHRLKPGITGLAQIRGFRGATETKRDLIDRLQSDLEYTQDWSIWRDLNIVVRTLSVFVHRNAF